MSSTLVIVLFAALIAGLGALVMLESRRRSRGPRTNSDAFRSQLGGTRVAYDPPPEKRTRSMAQDKR